MSNGSADPKERAWRQVGRFMYRFGRVEQKINQAVIKLTELHTKSAPIVDLIDIIKKVEDLVRPAAKAMGKNKNEKDLANDVCDRVHKMNQLRRIVAPHLLSLQVTECNSAER